MWLAPKKNDEFEVPYAGRVLRTHSGKTLIVDDDGNEAWVTDSEVGPGAKCVDVDFAFEEFPNRHYHPSSVCL